MDRKGDRETWRVIPGEATGVENRNGDLGSAMELNPHASADDAELDIAWTRFLERVSGETAHGRWEAMDSETQSSPDRTAKPQTGLAVSTVRDAPHPPSRERRVVVNRMTRRLASAGVAAAFVIGFLCTGWGNAVMADMFQTFTVQHLTVTNPNDMQTLEDAMKSLEMSGKSLNLAQFGQVSATKVGPPTTVSLKQAEQTIGFTLPVLPGVDPSAVRVRARMQFTFRIHVNAVNGILSQLGGTVDFPPSADGQPIVLQTNPLVEETSADGSRKLFVTKLPLLKVPSSVDVEQVRQAMLSLPFLPSDIRTDLASTSTWSDTLMLPNRGNLQDTSINGHDAIVDGRNLRIMWMKNGIVYGLQGTATAFPTTASLIQAAQGLDS